MEATGRATTNAVLGRNDVFTAMGLGALCYLLAFCWPVFVLASGLFDLPAASGGTSTPSTTHSVFFMVVVAGIISPILETLPFLAVGWLFCQFQTAGLIRTTIFFAGSWAYGFWGHGGGIGNVGRGMAFVVLGVQFWRYAIHGRLKSAFWLTAFSHAFYNALVLIVYAARQVWKAAH